MIVVIVLQLLRVFREHFQVEAHEEEIAVVQEIENTEILNALRKVNQENRIQSEESIESNN